MIITADRTKAKWLNDYSQLQPNLLSSKNAALIQTTHEKWKYHKNRQSQEKKKYKLYKETFFLYFFFHFDYPESSKTILSKKEEKKRFC